MGVNTFEVAEWEHRENYAETILSMSPLRVELEMTIDDSTRIVIVDVNGEYLDVHRPA